MNHEEAMQLAELVAEAPDDIKRDVTSSLLDHYRALLAANPLSRANPIPTVRRLR